MNTITPLSSIPALGSSTSRQGGQPQKGASETTLGDLLKATVFEAKSNNRYMLDFAGTKILASSQTPLAVGQQLQLQVTNTTPQVELTIVSDFMSALSGKPLVLLGSTIDISTLFASLQQGSPSALSTLSLPTTETLEVFIPPAFKSLISSQEGGPFLQKLFNRLGINFENLLSTGRADKAPFTLKAALLEVAQQFSNAEDISGQANKLLAALELYQFAQLQLGQQNVFIFPLPLPFLEQGYVLIEQDLESDSDTPGAQTEQKFAVHLTLTELGDMQIDFLKNEEGLFIKFHLDSQDKVEFVSQFTDLLTNMLSGVKLAKVLFSDSVESPASALVKKLLPKGESLLDTKV